MIAVEKIPEQELQQLRKKVSGNYYGMCLTMIIATIGFGLVFGQLEVTIICVVVIFLIFFLVKVMTSSGTPLPGDTKIIRTNKVTDVKLTTEGFKVRTTTIHVVLAKDEVPAPYTQTDTFMVYHSWGHLSGIQGVSRHNYQHLKGREVEVIYMADSGFVIGFKVLDQSGL